MRLLACISGIGVFAGTAIAQLQGSGLVVLDTGAQGALTMSGSSSVQIPARAVYVNSSSTSAVTTVGNAVLDVPNLYVVGQARFGANSRCTGHVIEHCVACADPMAGLVIPGASGLADRGAASISGGTVTLQPGHYPHGISVSGNNAQVTFAPGVYVISGDVHIGGGTITADGVTLVMLDGTLSISGQTALTLTPPTSGALNGMVIAQPAANTHAMNLSGGSSINISGGIYAPSAALTLTGGSGVSGAGPQMGDLVIAKRVSLTGTGSIKIGHPLSPALQLPTQPLYD